MDNQEIIRMTDSELKDLLRSCTEEELPNIKKLILDNNRLPIRSVAAIIKYRNPYMRKVTGRAVTGWTKKLSKEDYDRWRKSVGGPRSEEARKNMSLAQLANRGNEEISRRRSDAQVRRFERDGTSNHCSSKYNFYYNLNGKYVYLDSTYEVRAIQTYNKLGIKLESEPLKLYYEYDNKKRCYIPDFTYEDNHGILHILEVKPMRLVDDLVKYKLNVAKSYYPDSICEIITESDLDEIDWSDTNIIKYKLPYKKGRVREWIYPSK